MAEIVEVYGREFEVGKPRVHDYLNLLQFVKRVVRDGYADQLSDLSNSADEVGGIEFFLELAGAVEEEHLTHLAAVLLQGDIDETIAFIEDNGGVELGWMMEAFAINCELADLEQVVESFRRAQEAIKSWSQA